MLIDLLDTNNYLQVNITTAQIFGLQSAVYISEIINILQKAAKKKKLIDGNYVKLDRKYIFNRTTIDSTEQLKIDKKLMELNILQKHKDDADTITFDLTLFASIVAEEDLSVIKNIKKNVKVKTAKEEKETQKQAMIKTLKESVVCSNYELLTAFRNWIEAIVNNPKIGWLSKLAVTKFVNRTNEYSQGDLDVALKIVEIATIQCYRDCDWAISIYENSKKQIETRERESKERISTRVRVTEQKRATNESVDRNIIF